MTNSYVEGDVDMVSDAAPWCSITPTSKLPTPLHTVGVWLPALATLSASFHWRLLAINSRLTPGDGVAQLGRSLDDANTNGQVAIRDSVINEGFNVAKPWADAVISNVRLLEIREPWMTKHEVQRNSNDTNYNRMWEYNNRGVVGSKVVAEPKQ